MLKISKSGSFNSPAQMLKMLLKSLLITGKFPLVLLFFFLFVLSF